jgi:hypothetical protein
MASRGGRTEVPVPHVALFEPQVNPHRFASMCCAECDQAWNRQLLLERDA